MKSFGKNLYSAHLDFDDPNPFFSLLHEIIPNDIEARNDIGAFFWPSEGEFLAATQNYLPTSDEGYKNAVFEHFLTDTFSINETNFSIETVTAFIQLTEIAVSFIEVSDFKHSNSAPFFSITYAQNFGPRS